MAIQSTRKNEPSYCSKSKQFTVLVLLLALLPASNNLRTFESTFAPVDSDRMEHKAFDPTSHSDFSAAASNSNSAAQASLNVSKPARTKKKLPHVDINLLTTTRCLDQDTTSSGWGNLIYVLLYTHAVNEQKSTLCLYPGPIGKLVARLFWNINLCESVKNRTDDCVRNGPIPPKKWPRIIKTVHQRYDPAANNTELRNYLVLNRTFMSGEVHGSSPDILNKLAQTCAIHVRFGDGYFRASGSSDNRNRGCQTSRDARGNFALNHRCFDTIAKEAHGKCSYSPYLFVASDLLKFREYLVQRNTEDSRYREVWYTDFSELVHNGDDPYDTFGEQWLNMLRDWTSLLLANTTHILKRSTFAKMHGLKFRLSDAEGDGAETN